MVVLRNATNWDEEDGSIAHATFFSVEQGDGGDRASDFEVREIDV